MIVTMEMVTLVEAVVVDLSTKVKRRDFLTKRMENMVVLKEDEDMGEDAVVVVVEGM